MIIRSLRCKAYATPLVFLIGLLVVLNVHSCNCRNGNTDQPRQYKKDKRLSMQVLYTPDKDLITLTFTTQQTVDLKELHLKITPSTDGVIDIRYQDSTGSNQVVTNKLEKSLDHFSANTHLTPKQILQLDFTTSLQKAPSVVVSFELIDQAANTLQKDSVRLESKPNIPPVKITQLKYNPATQSIICDIQNSGNKPVAGNLKFRINRDQGTQATIEESVPKDSAYEIEVAEAIPADGQVLTKTFKVNSPTDPQTTFTFQAIYVENGKEQPMGDPVTVSWKKEVQMALKDIQLLPSTNEVTYTIANTSKEAAESITLHWDLKTPGAQIVQANLLIQKLDIGDLGAETEKKDRILGQLDFGTNTNVQIDFWLQKKDNPIPYAQKSITFTKQVDVQLVLKDIQLLPAANEVTYTVANTSKKAAESITLHWDLKTPGAQIVQANLLIQKLDIGDLGAETEKKDRILGQLDFGTNTNVQIDFWLQKKDNPIPYAQKSITFTKQVDVQLVLKDIQLLPAANEVTYTVANTSKKAAESITLHWDLKTPGAQIVQANLLIQKLDIGDLGAETEKKDRILGQLDFGTNTNVQIDFWLQKKDNPIPYAQKSITFTKQVDVQLVLKDIQLLPAANEVTYTVANTSKKAAESITLHWDLKTPGAQIVQANLPIQKLEIGDLAAETEKKNQVLGQLDFGTNVNVQIDFWLQNKGNPNPYAKVPITFTKQVDVQLVLLATGPTALTGKETTIKCKIEKKDPSGPVDERKITLEIGKGPRSKAKILHNGQEVKYDVHGSKLGNLGQDICLTLEPDPIKNYEYVTCELRYNGKRFNSVTFRWYKDPSTNIFEAARRGDVAAVKEFIQNGANVNESSGLNAPPLCIASENNRSEVVKELLQTPGVQVDIQDSIGGTPLLRAAEKGNLEIVKKLLQHGAKTHITSSLDVAVANGYLEIVKELISHNVNINAVDKNGRSPLLAATEKESIEIIKVLLQNGADANKGDTRFGYTPLHEAIQKGNLPVVQELIKHGANVNQQDIYYNKTPLQLATEKGHQSIIEELKKHGAK